MREASCYLAEYDVLIHERYHDYLKGGRLLIPIQQYTHNKTWCYQGYRKVKMGMSFYRNIEKLYVE